MKTSGLFESLLIIMIIVLFCMVAVADSHTIDEILISDKGISCSYYTNTKQINHPELHFGPVGGFFSCNYFNHSKSYHFSRVTTTDSYFKSVPLAPSGVYFDIIKYMDGKKIFKMGSNLGVKMRNTA